MVSKNNNLIWLDLEMTGLDHKRHTIIEIALVATDKDLKILDKTDSIAIQTSKSKLAKMNEWCTTQHYQSGLVDRVLNSTIKLKNAEEIAINFMAKYVIVGQSPMCGNSIATDRSFIKAYMPELYKMFHYRNLDVSTLKELVLRWYPNDTEFSKESKHLALDDVLDSIAELKYYRNKFFKG